MGAVKLFTLAEANGLIPWLERAMEAQRACLERIASLARGIQDVTGPTARPTLEPTDGEPERVRGLKLELRSAIRALRETADSIESLGLCVTDMRAGSVDFPAFHGGASVWLCWAPGEKRIGFWHDDCDCTAGRRPLESAVHVH